MLQDPGTPGIAQFILARIGEDEDLAVHVVGGSGHGDQVLGDRWHVPTGDGGEYDVVDPTGRDVVYLQPGEGGGAVTEQVAHHIARYDPARARAEAELKRLLMSQHVGCPKDPEPCEVLRRLAACYQEHPDWQPAWAPV